MHLVSETFQRLHRIFSRESSLSWVQTISAPSLAAISIRDFRLPPTTANRLDCGIFQRFDHQQPTVANAKQPADRTELRS